MSIKSNDRRICFNILTDSFNLGFPPKPSSSESKQLEAGGAAERVITDRNKRVSVGRALNLNY